MNPQPTEEQSLAIEEARRGQTLAVEALAGTGKTTTLSMIADVALRSGLYVTFSKAMVVDASQRFPSHVECKTAHALAFAAVGHKYRERLNAARMPYRHVAAALGCHEVTVRDGRKCRTVPKPLVARMALQGLRTFVKSLDDTPGPSHLPLLPATDPASMNELNAHVGECVRRAWDDMQRPNGVLPFNHDVYLKIWQLQKPRLPTNCILFDEAQDADPVMLDIILSQQCQKILVGDRNQQVYAWRGAINAIETLPIANRVWLTQSFRFGEAIADEANTFLRGLGSARLLRGCATVESAVGRVSRPEAILCRTNSGVLKFVMQLRQANASVAVIDDLRKSLLRFARAAQRLKAGQVVEDRELAAFTTWAEVEEYVADVEPSGELAQLVRLVQEYGSEAIVRVLEQCTEEMYAEVLVSTAHRAKGREWNSVGVASDYPSEAEMGEDERRLAYVAVTRARRGLDRSHWQQDGTQATRWFIEGERRESRSMAVGGATHLDAVFTTCPQCGSEQVRHAQDLRQDVWAVWCSACKWEYVGALGDAHVLGDVTCERTRDSAIGSGDCSPHAGEACPPPSVDAARTPATRSRQEVHEVPESKCGLGTNAQDSQEWIRDRARALERKWRGHQG